MNTPRRFLASVAACFYAAFVRAERGMAMHEAARRYECFYALFKLYGGNPETLTWTFDSIPNNRAHDATQPGMAMENGGEMVRGASWGVSVDRYCAYRRFFSPAAIVQLYLPER